MEELFQWRSENTLYMNNYILNGEVLSTDMYKTFSETVDPDIAILTGATTNEFANDFSLQGFNYYLGRKQVTPPRKN